LPPQSLCLASFPTNPKPPSPSLCSRIVFVCARHLPLVLPKMSRKATIPFRIISFADPHHLTSIESYSYKNRGRGWGPSLPARFLNPFLHSATVNSHRIRSSAKRARNPFRMRSFKTQDLKQEYMAPSLDCTTTDVACIGRKDICSRLRSLAARLKAECLAKKREHMILKTVRHLACVSARIHFETIRDSILIKDFVELCGIGSQTVLVTDIDGDRTIPPETSDVLINESEWCICSPFCKNVGLWRSILRGQVEIKRRILRVG